MQKKETSRDYITQARPPPLEKGETLHTDHYNGSPWWDSTTDSSPRYHEKNQIL